MNLKSYMRRYIFIAVVILVLIVAFELIKKAKLESKVLETNATPITNKIVVLDAGHGLPDERCGWLFWNDRASNKFSYSFKITKIN